MDLQRLPDTIFSSSTGDPTSIPPLGYRDEWWRDGEREEQHLTWISIVGNYSARQVSVFSDRLPAITGVINELSRIWDDRCDFGTWQARLFPQLAWFAEIPQRQTNAVMDVPSWSWLRLNNRVKHLEISANKFLYSQGASARVEDGHLVVANGDFVPANEMTKERRHK